MFRKALFSAAIALGLVSASIAVTGIPPIANGPILVDGTWLLGLAGGLNNTSVSGLTAAGTTQATASQIPSGNYLVEIDTAAASTGMMLPFAYSGTDMLVYNNGAQTVTIYPNVTNNPITAAQDTINNTTSVTIASHSSAAFSSAKNGIWFSK